MTRDGYKLQVLVSPNKAAAPDDFALRITRRAARRSAAPTVTLAFNHLQMEMPQQTYALREVAPGRVPPQRARADHGRARGAWPSRSPRPGAPPFTALIVDQADG